MKWIMLLSLTLLSVVPRLWAYRTGAPEQACGNLMPNHGVPGSTDNDGFFILSDVIDGDSYTPGQTYEVTLVSTIGDFAGFLVQARAENNQPEIVGTWTTTTDEAQTVGCNGVAGTAVTHTSSSRKTNQVFMWTAPSDDVGRIDFIYTVVRSMSNFFVRLNATELRPPSTIPPPPPPPPDAVFPNSYGQPEGCQQQNCTFYVEWRNNGDFIDFRMEGDGNGWIAMGITAQDSPLDRANRNFSDILLCQAEPNGDTANVKDLFLEGGSLMPANDVDDNGTEHTSGVIANGRIFCNFSRVVFALLIQEGQDISFSDDNYLFFLSGDEQGELDAIPTDFSMSASDPTFSSRRISLIQGFVLFLGTFSDLPGEGSYPTSTCSREDCDFYLRWGVNSNNPNYLTFFISADLSRGWAAVGVSTDRRMGGEEIDDIFGCSTDASVARSFAFADTYNVDGGDRQNVGDSSGEVGIIPHSFGIVDGRIECTFSRIISVLPGEEGSDFNLDARYYVMIGTGGNPGTPFPRHERNPEWSTSRVNLVRETSVDFDYARVPLIRTHGILMVFAWPVLAWLGIGMARHMKPALPNGGWFLLHRVLVISSLFFTCLSFALIFIAFRNTEFRGLITLGSMNEVGTAHFAIGIVVVAFQLINPIIALFRCHPGTENRWIFNVVHGVIVGAGAEILSAINILLGLYLFGDKIIDSENYDSFLPFWIMIALVVAFGVVDFTLYVFFLISRYACEERTKPTESDNIEMKQYGSGGEPPKPKKDPSDDHWIRWIGWITMATIVITLGLAIIVMIAVG